MLASACFNVLEAAKHVTQTSVVSSGAGSIAWQVTVSETKAQRDRETEKHREEEREELN
jgi:hypothetical protein